MGAATEDELMQLSEWEDEMRVQRWFSWIALLACGSPCLAQSDAAPSARNAVFLELLGNGGLYSVNFERMLNQRVALRIGFAAWNSPALLYEGTPPDRYQAVPVTASYLLGPGERKLEIGGGVTFGRGTLDRFSDERKDFSFTSLTAIIGYRSQPPGRGYLFRAGVTPFYSLDKGDEAYPDPGSRWAPESASVIGSEVDLQSGWGSACSTRSLRTS
jgi:hypothetical protein